MTLLASWHAQLRWLQRVDPKERYPGSAIRRAVENAEEIGTDGGGGRIVHDERHNVELVIHRSAGVSTVATVLPPGCRGGRGQ